ncbi:hypothetical protein BCR36DRAFT_585809 [Piromyces finnis]|uniref:Uncharacterized protein n=1 Tax=Piromyces finnis TaxID=1754191 RepID=A0A1Y1V3P4_9FUNG|nr:hypothetical protein BCR36DRAFT_585809 [Piromyces finnis]|eukprot:ORX45197.1 hypothetical protein BCR36DRAFT_585809 [Piromyces finnis]
MQNNLMEKESVESKRLSTATSVSLSVATSASPSLLSETSFNNSILSKSPTPSSISNYVNNQIQGKETKSESEKKKLKNVLHKFFKTKKIFIGSNHGHHKKNSYSQNLGDEKNIYGYSTIGKSILNADENLSKNANTVSTSQPASLYYINNQANSTQSNIENNYLTTPNSLSQQQHLQLNEDNKFPTYYSREELELKLKSETEKNICSDKLTAKEFAAEVGIIPINEEDEDSNSVKSSHLNNVTYSSFFTNNGIQNTYNSTKSYGPRLDMSLFDPPNKISSENLNESKKTIIPEYNQRSSFGLSSSSDIDGSLGAKGALKSKDSENETIEILDIDSLSKSNIKENDIEKAEAKFTTQTRSRIKKLSRFEVEVLSGNTPKSAMINSKKPSINTLGLGEYNQSHSHPNSAKLSNSFSSPCYLNATSSLPNLNDLNKIMLKNGSGYHTTPSSPARRDYGIPKNDNVYFVCSNAQTRKPRRVSLSKHSPMNSLDEKNGKDAKEKLRIIVDIPNEDDNDSMPSSASTSSSASPIHFEAKHQYSTTTINSSVSKIDIYNLNNNETANKARNMTTTIITPEIIKAADDSKNSSSESNSLTTTPINTPSPEELKNIWIDKTIGGNTNCINKFHITNFQTEISKADNTIHTTTASHIKDAMTNTDSVVFPIQIIKTPIGGKCNTYLSDSKVTNEDIQPSRFSENKTKSLHSKNTIIDEEKNNEKSEKNNLNNKEKSEDSSNVVQVIQKGRFTIMKEHHDYKHAVSHHYKFVIIRNPSSNVLLPQTSGDSLTSSSLSSIPSYSYIDPTKNKDVKHSHKETLSTIITPTSSSGLTLDKSSMINSSSNTTSPPGSPYSTCSPTLSTISIPHQQLANIAAASLSSNLNLSEGIAYTTTIDSNGKAFESNKSEEHVLIVPTNDEKQNNLTCIQSFTSSVTPISTSLYISTITPVQTSLNKDLMHGIGPTTTPLNEDTHSTTTTPLMIHSITPSSTPSNSPSLTPSNIHSQESSLSSSPVLFNQLSSTSTSPLMTSKPTEEVKSISSTDSRDIKLESSQTTNSSSKESKAPVSNISGVSQALIPNCSIESKYPTLNSTVTLVNNQNMNQNSVLSEDISIYTNYSDETCIHNDNESKSCSKLCEEINCIKPIMHSDTDIRRIKKNEIEDANSLRKVQSVLQYSDKSKLCQYYYDSIDNESSLEIEDEENGEIVKKSLNKNNFELIEINSNKVDREVVTSPMISKSNIEKRKYFPTHSYDQVVHPQDLERKDSYYEFEQNESSMTLGRKYSDASFISSSVEPSSNSINHNENEKTRTCSMSAICASEASSKNLMESSDKETVKTSTTASGEYPTHPHHHHHFFVISNSEADIHSPSLLKYNNEFLKDGNCNTRTVISSRQHRKFDITTSSISTKTPSIASIKTMSTNSLIKHRRTPSNSSSMSSHSRFTIIRESNSKNVNNEKSPLSSSNSTTKKQSRFTVTRNAIN